MAKTSKNEDIINLLEEFVNTEEVELILPRIIFDEFERNKDRIIADAGRSLSSHFKKVKEMIVEHGKDDEKENILSHINDIDKKIPNLGENAIKSISNIEKLMKMANVINITDKIKLNAVQRAIDKIAPFHLSKNSVGDAIIIEAFNEYRLQNSPQDFKIIFVTHNINDFSSKTGNQKTPHDDLIPIFDNNKSYYFIDLLEALNFINPDLVEEVEDLNNWDFEFRNYSEILKIEREFEQKIWYRRHKYREYLINEGKIRIIKRDEFETADTQSTIIDDIWKGALKSAKKVEKIYGKENLQFDDFEWGMINGKLSALRWVIGDNWDNLDT